MNPIWFVVIGLVGIAAYTALVYAIMFAVFLFREWMIERKIDKSKKEVNNDESK